MRYPGNKNNEKKNKRSGYSVGGAEDETSGVFSFFEKKSDLRAMPLAYLWPVFLHFWFFVVCKLLEKRFEYVKCRITSPAVCLFGYTTVLYWRRSYLSSHVSDARQRERKRPRWKTPSLSFFLSFSVRTCRGDFSRGGTTPSGFNRKESRYTP